MDGKGGVKYIDSEWLRSFDKVKAIENSLRKDINSRIEEIAPTLADGESRSVSYSVSPQIIFTEAFSSTELFWASGTSTINVSVTLDLNRDGDIVQAHADVFLDWRDKYNWDPWKSVVIPGYGRIYDRANEMLQVCKNAKPFSMASSWKLNFDTNVKVDDVRSVGCTADGMSGNNVVPPTDARSTGVEDMDPRDGIVTAIHVHLGKEGENGRILFSISGPDYKLPPLPTSLAGADLYVDVHTDKYPNGAIRGNLCLH
jgi:hypothetical protein